MQKQALEKLNISQLNPMQEAAIKASEKQDLILLSPTGSGKTLAFLLPVLGNMKPEEKGVQALILVPTRELAIQIEQVFKQMGTGFGVKCFYGGRNTNTEKNSLTNPPALLIGTPGRIAYHLREQNFNGSSTQILVLDEFDKSLEMGFEEEMKYIIGELPNITKRLLTSATAMRQIPAFTGLKNPAKVNFLQDEVSAPDLEIKEIQVPDGDKTNALFRLLCKLGNKPTLVFCNQRDAVENVSDFLKDKNLAHGIFHGGLEQADRERALMKFRNGTYQVLISTDLAARGLDIPEIENVVHYDLGNAEAYTHRNGRTARMQAKGTVYLVLNPTNRPDYLPANLSIESLPANPKLPPVSPWETIYISAGKKDKISKGDVAGFLLQKNHIGKEDLGLIFVQDYVTFATVNRAKAGKLVKALETEKLKGKKVKKGLAK